MSATSRTPADPARTTLPPLDNRPGPDDHENPAGQAAPDDRARPESRPAPDDQDERAELEKLAAALRARGLQADLRTPEGRLAYLDVRNPRATVLGEKVYAQAGTFWWSWAEKIAGTDEVSTAAGILVRVLRTVGE
jgi:hypothetical protein